MTPADRDTLLTLVQQWEGEVAYYRTGGEIHQQIGAVYAFCAEQLRDYLNLFAPSTALLARLTPPDPETP